MGGRGQQELKLSQLKLSQLGLRGGRVKSIETLSQNMQFLFLEASLNIVCVMLGGNINLSFIVLSSSKKWNE